MYQNKCCQHLRGLRHISIEHPSHSHPIENLESALDLQNFICKLTLERNSMQTHVCKNASKSPSSTNHPLPQQTEHREEEQPHNHGLTWTARLLWIVCCGGPWAENFKSHDRRLCANRTEARGVCSRRPDSSAVVLGCAAVARVAPGRAQGPNALGCGEVWGLLLDAFKVALFPWIWRATAAKGVEIARRVGRGSLGMRCDGGLYCDGGNAATAA